jgi:hypothetical protein
MNDNFSLLGMFIFSPSQSLCLAARRAARTTPTLPSGLLQEPPYPRAAFTESARETKTFAE